jgi:peroxin-14
MATVVGGAGYGLWTLAERYVKPLIAPPTPPQLEQDKAAIDEQFNKAFALLDTLTADTAALKEAEEERTKRLDSAITDIEGVIAEIKAANSKREDDSRRMEAEIKSMKDGLPKSIDSVKEASERQLKELSGELQSLKLLMTNRMAGSTSLPGQGIPKTQPANISSVNANAAGPTPSESGQANGVGVAGKIPSYPIPSSNIPPVNQRPASTGPLGTGSSKAAIPTWQMAAQNKQKDFNVAPIPGLPTAPPADGADAVAALGAS